MALSGLRRLDHVGFTVPDLDEATRFLVDVLGCEYLYSLGPFAGRGRLDGRAPQRAPARDVPENRFFRLAAGGRSSRCSPTPRPTSRPRSPATATSAATTSPSTSTTWTPPSPSCARRGVTVFGEPTASRHHHEGQRWVYFLAPWGMQFELVSYPNGKAWDIAHAAEKAGTGT